MVFFFPYPVKGGPHHFDRGLFLEKRPPQAKNFWGPFFQKFDGFWEKFTVFSGFNGFLTVFSASTTKKSPPQAKNLGTPFFAFGPFIKDVINRGGRGGPRTKMKKSSENFWRASGAQKKGYPNFSPAAPFFSLWRH